MSLKLICKIAKMPRSTYYYNEKESCRKEKDQEIIDMIKALPKKDKQRGSKAKTKIIKERYNKTVNHKRIERICRENGLLSKIRRRKFPKDYYKQQKENMENLPKNLLNREFSSDKPFKKLCSDVSYFKTTSGWLYFSPVLDLYRNRIVCYVISKYNNEELAQNTLKKLKAVAGDLSGAMMHTDQGSINTAKEFRERLEEYGMIQSMSRRGNCWDNACMEHFFGTLKVESGYDELLKTKLLSYEKTAALIEEYVKYYNYERLQEKLNWQKPYEDIA